MQASSKPNFSSTICAMLWRGAAGVGASRRIAATVAVATGTIWATWVLVNVMVAGAGVYRFAPNKAQPWLPVAMAVSLAAVLLATRLSVVSRILAQPDARWRLTVPQYFRFEGVAFLSVLALGKLPAGFALPAGLGDIERQTHIRPGAKLEHDMTAAARPAGSR